MAILKLSSKSESYLIRRDLMFPHHDNELAQAEAYHDCSQVWRFLQELDILSIAIYICIYLYLTGKSFIVVVGEFFHTLWTSVNWGFKDVKISEELHYYQRCMYFKHSLSFSSSIQFCFSLKWHVACHHLNFLVKSISIHLMYIILLDQALKMYTPRQLRLLFVYQAWDKVCTA